MINERQDSLRCPNRCQYYGSQNNMNGICQNGGNEFDGLNRKYECNSTNGITAMQPHVQEYSGFNNFATNCYNDNVLGLCNSMASSVGKEASPAVFGFDSQLNDEVQMNNSCSGQLNNNQNSCTDVRNTTINFEPVVKHREEPYDSGNLENTFEKEKGEVEGSACEACLCQLCDCSYHRCDNICDRHRGPNDSHCGFCSACVPLREEMNLQTTYQSEYIPTDCILRSSRRIVEYKPPDGDMDLKTTYQNEFFTRDCIPRKRKEVNLYAAPPGNMDFETTYQSEFYTRDCLPRKRKEVNLYVAPPGDMDLGTTYQNEFYARDCIPRRYKTKEFWRPAEGPMDLQTTYQSEYVQRDCIPPKKKCTCHCCTFDKRGYTMTHKNGHYYYNCLC